MASFSIELQKKYKSLVPFFWSDIPNLCVITGINGSGKSHLLEMIARKCQAVGNDSNSPDHDAVAATISGIEVGSGKVLFVPADRQTDFSDKVTLEEVEKRIAQLYDLPVQNGKNSAKWRSVRPLYDGFVVPVADQPERKDVVRPSLAEFRLRLTAAVIAQGSLAGRNPNLAMLFFSHALLHANLVCSGKTSQQADQLLNTPPWLRLDEIFEAAGIHLRCEAPYIPTASIFNEERHYVLRFKDSRTGQLVSPNSLSSGEKALCALLFLEYSTQLEASRYGLILLDEPDAHLHPDFVRRFFNVLQSIAVNKCRILLTTHSPTTVAIAPDDSLYLLHAPGTGAPEKVSRGVALARLLSGVPALSVIAENNRQVFVESQYDAVLYASLYSILRGYWRDVGIRPDVSLSFVASGSGGSGSCDDVVAVVSALRNNPFVAGLIDWDRKATRQERIEIVGQGERYSIENFVFDPIVLAAFLLHHRYVDDIAGVKASHQVAQADAEAQEMIAEWIGASLLDALNRLRTNPASLGEAERAKLNACFSECAKVLEVGTGEYVDRGEKVRIGYCSGLNVSIPQWLLLLRGHDLEELVLFAFPKLKRHSRRANELKATIIDHVLGPYPELIPRGIATALAALQGGMATQEKRLPDPVNT
jgi:predicted ATPase